MPAALGYSQSRSTPSNPYLSEKALSFCAKANRFEDVETREEKYRLPVHPPTAKTALELAVEEWISGVLRTS